jgi:hypothetical protein
MTSTMGKARRTIVDHVVTSIVHHRLRCSVRAVDPTLDFVGVVGRGVGYRDAAIF